MANGFQGLEGQTMPTMPDDFVHSVTDRYVELYETITGKKFERTNTEGILNRIENNIVNYLNG